MMDDCLEDSARSSKKVNIEKRESAFGSSTGRTRSYQEEAAVPPDLRSQLESIGMRTRFNVSRGYGSPPPSLLSQDRFETFPTDSQILETVKRTKNSWNRTKSAPLYSNELVPFCGLRAELDVDGQKDIDDDPTRYINTLGKIQGSSIEDDEGVIGIGDLKRNRDDVFGQWAEEEEENKASPAMELDSPKRIAGLPQRGSSSPFGRNRLNAQIANTLPINSGLSSYLASAQDSQWTSHDFSSFTNKHDF